ncbi:MAG: hypothetical protein NTW04_00585, partial [Elusimicrobia bacterium]|nr:hypothetical protein [Elusimicrobiota bacterium]
SKRTFFLSVWKLVIFSRIIEFISNNILLRDKNVGYQKHEDNVISFVEQNALFLKFNFFGAVKEILTRVNNEQKQAPAILEEVYRQYLNPLKHTLREYFKITGAHQQKIIILADNLDQTWDAKHDLEVQSEMIQTLLEIGIKIKGELIVEDNSKIDVQTIVFLRKDIFEYIMKEVLEPDKFTSMLHEINWENYPDLLRKVVEDRFRHILNLHDTDDVDVKAWGEFFDIGEQEDPYSIIEPLITRRPRDLIYFLSQMFASAFDKRHSKANNEDLKFAIHSYTQFLSKNVIAETKAEFPEISQILTKLQEYHGEKLEYQKFKNILTSFKYDEEKVEKLTEALFKEGYMIGFDQNTNQPFSDIEKLKDRLNERRLFFFQNKVYVIAHANYYYIKNKRPSAFG